MRSQAHIDWSSVNSVGSSLNGAANPAAPRPPRLSPPHAHSATHASGGPAESPSPCTPLPRTRYPLLAVDGFQSRPLPLSRSPPLAFLSLMTKREDALDYHARG